MKIAGFKKQSLIDYPGNISSVIFTQGCNFRCGFCHNPNLVLPEKFGPTYTEDYILNYISTYSHLLDAICITGGEPTIHADLPNFIEKIKEFGIKVKLDSNGTNPQMIKELISSELIDSIAMDIKHRLDFEHYNRSVGNSISRKTFSDIVCSIELIKSANIEYEFRTTVARGLHNTQDIMILKKQFKTHYKLQNFNPEITLNPELELKPFSDTAFKALCAL